MEQFLTENDNDVQAVLSENDSMAGGVVAALEAQGLAGQVPVGGQDGDLRRPQPGRSRHPNGERLEGLPHARRGRWRGGLELCANPDIAAVAGTAPFDVAGGQRADVDILRSSGDHPDNLDVVLDAGWIDQATLCQGVEPGTVAGVRRSGGFGAGGHRGGGHRAPADTGAVGTAPATTGG